MTTELNLFDSHTHLYLPEFAEDDGGAATVRRAIEAGVQRMVFPNVDLTTIAPMKALAAKFPDRVYMAMGLHPTEVNESWEEDTIRAIDELGDGREYVAVGEIGIDLYWDKTYEQQQMLSLDMQMQRANALGKPVIIHCREGLDQVLEVISQYPEVNAVFHSFGGTIEDVQRIRKAGDYYFGINGIVTFKNCKVRDTLAEIGETRLLLETDAPYLAPVPHRGKRNETAYMVHTAAHVASVLGKSIEEIGAVTTSNALSFFKIDV